MTGVDERRLQEIYAHSDDPWTFRTSRYEAAKFAATFDALPRPHYRSGLELGCGNGELARRIAQRCDAYTGLDAVETALIAARLAVPKASFHQGFLPCPLPEGLHDLVVLSEILYFLGTDGIDWLAEELDDRCPDADIVCVTWRGPSGNPLEGEAALALFFSALGDHRSAATVRLTSDYRIDVLRPLGLNRNYS
jgi:SAM-dependent methyltransferase